MLQRKTPIRFYLNKLFISQRIKGIQLKQASH